jgi:hypothetical protein
MAAFPADQTGLTESAVFIPELWSDEIIAAYKANLVVGSLVTHFQHNGRKGDTIHLPTPARGTASLKAAGTAVTNQATTETEITIPIDKHYEYSRTIEDIAGAQALDSLRMFYTDDAGHSLATQIDSDLHAVAESFQTGTTTNLSFDTGVIGSDGVTAYTNGADNAAALSDAGLRRVIRTLDDANVPQGDRALVIPPVEKENLLGLSRFTEQAFVGEVGAANSIRNGMVGSVYGVPVYVSTNCSTTQANSNRACILFHKSAMTLVTQIDIRVQTQYKQEYLATLMTADTLYGVAELRNDAGVAIIVPG